MTEEPETLHRDHTEICERCSTRLTQHNRTEVEIDGLKFYVCKGCADMEHGQWGKQR